MKELIEVFSNLLNDLIAGKSDITTIIVVFFSSLIWTFNIIGKNNVIGLEDYETRKKTRFTTCLMFILFFGIATFILSTYNTWITFMIANYDSKKDNVALLGLLYICVAVFTFVLCLFHLIFVLPKKITKDMDEYDKKYQTETLRFAFYISVCFFLLGLAIILQNLKATVIIIFVIIVLGIITLFLPDCESDRALLYFKDTYFDKIYIYRTIDNDKLLCGVKKNALSCNYYIVKNKKDIFEHELHLVDEKSTKISLEKSNIKRNNNILHKIIENNFVIVSLIVIFAITYYLIKKFQILFFLFELILIVFLKDWIQEKLHFCIKKIKEFIILVINWLRESKIFIAEILYFIILVLRIVICNKLPLLEWMLHMLISSKICIHLKPIIINSYNEKIKARKKHPAK